MNPAARTFQQEMFAQSIPLAAFEVAGIQNEYTRLKGHGVVFTREPVKAGPVTIAVFSDTCGNLIQMYQPGLSFRNRWFRGFVILKASWNLRRQ